MCNIKEDNLIEVDKVHLRVTFNFRFEDVTQNSEPKEHQRVFTIIISQSFLFISR